MFIGWVKERNEMGGWKEFRNGVSDVGGWVGKEIITTVDIT